MKTVVYISDSACGSKRVMFYKKPGYGWRFIVTDGNWIDAPDDIARLYDEHTKHVVNNFKEKHK